MSRGERDDPSLAAAVSTCRSIDRRCHCRWANRFISGRGLPYSINAMVTCVWRLSRHSMRSGWSQVFRVADPFKTWQHVSPVTCLASFGTLFCCCVCNPNLTVQLLLIFVCLLSDDPCRLKNRGPDPGMVPTIFTTSGSNGPFFYRTFVCTNQG